MVSGKWYNASEDAVLSLPLTGRGQTPRYIALDYLPHLLGCRGGEEMAHRRRTCRRLRRRVTFVSPCPPPSQLPPSTRSPAKPGAPGSPKTTPNPQASGSSSTRPPPTKTASPTPTP